MSNQSVGARGEELAYDFLLKKGYEILGRNVRFSRFSEIDIIARFKNVLIFVEVKTRKSEICGSPFEAITKSKYENIKKGIFFYLQENKIKYDRYRIDAISVILEPEVKINHLENI